jgi:hypothetical protein
MAGRQRVTNERGIYVGGSLTGVASVGDHSVTVQMSSSSPAEASISSIRQLIARHRSGLDKPEFAEGDLDEIERELSGEERDHDRLGDALRRLARRVAPVGEIAVAVAALANAILS